jgi:hypothetical protein
MHATLKRESQYLAGVVAVLAELVTLRNAFVRHIHDAILTHPVAFFLVLSAMVSLAWIYARFKHPSESVIRDGLETDLSLLLARLTGTAYAVLILAMLTPMRVFG